MMLSCYYLLTLVRLQVKHVVDEQTYSKYEEFTLASALNAMPDIRWCPKPDCKNAMVLNVRILSTGWCLFCSLCGTDRRRGESDDGVLQLQL